MLASARVAMVCLLPAALKVVNSMDPMAARASASASACKSLSAAILATSSTSPSATRFVYSVTAALAMSSTDVGAKLALHTRALRGDCFWGAVALGKRGRDARLQL